jgi:hypothetical protein
MSFPQVYPLQTSALPKEGMSLKEKLGYGIAASVVLGTGIYFLNRSIKKQKAKKSDLKSFEDGTPQTVAKQIKLAFENDGWFGTDLEKLRYVMGTLKSKEQWKLVMTEYRKQFNSNLLQDMKDELQSSEYDEMMFIKESKPEKSGQKITKDVLYKNWAKRLKSAFDKTYSFVPGTDEKALKTVFMEIPTQKDFVYTGLAYEREYKSNFIKDLKSELEYWEYPTYMTIIAKKPKA